jgi:hypothetical protein
MMKFVFWKTISSDIEYTKKKSLVVIVKNDPEQWQTHAETL